MQEILFPVEREADGAKMSWKKIKEGEWRTADDITIKDQVRSLSIKGKTTIPNSIYQERRKLRVCD